MRICFVLLGFEPLQQSACTYSYYVKVLRCNTSAYIRHRWIGLVFTKLVMNETQSICFANTQYKRWVGHIQYITATKDLSMLTHAAETCRQRLIPNPNSLVKH